jgi:hypothetical protein
MPMRHRSQRSTLNSFQDALNATVRTISRTILGRVAAGWFIVMLALPISIARGENGMTGTEMAGRFGIGTDFRDIGFRYWMSEKTAAELKINFGISDYETDGGSFFQSSEGDGDSYGVGLYAVRVLAQKGGLRFVGSLGLQYDWSRSKREFPDIGETDESFFRSISLNGGLGAEYSFQELPDLSFGVFFGGVGIGYDKAEFETTSFGVTEVSSTTSRYVNTSPRAGLLIQYYF